MEDGEGQMRKHLLDVTDIYLIIKCTHWHITFNEGIRKH